MQYIITIIATAIIDKEPNKIKITTLLVSCVSSVNPFPEQRVICDSPLDIDVTPFFGPHICIRVLIGTIPTNSENIDA